MKKIDKINLLLYILLGIAIICVIVLLVLLVYCLVNGIALNGSTKPIVMPVIIP